MNKKIYILVFMLVGLLLSGCSQPTNDNSQNEEDIIVENPTENKNNQEENIEENISEDNTEEDQEEVEEVPEENVAGSQNYQLDLDKLAQIKADAKFSDETTKTIWKI